MNRKWIYGGGAAGFLALVVLAMVWSEMRCRSPWTGESEPALRAFEDGLLDLDRHYMLDAVADFRHALELDPNFAMAKLHLLMFKGGDSEELERWWQELQALPEDALSERERFLIDYYELNHRQSDADGAGALLDAYLQEPGNAEDPFALDRLCHRKWEMQSWTEARACYQRLLKAHPNSVDARTRLGLIAMAEGDFELAEENFRTFVFVAPDQANSHDSLGQLQTVLGRYEEAEAGFQKALDIKPDYCAALRHGFRLYQLWGRDDDAAAMLEAMEGAESCDYLKNWGILCAGSAAVAASRGDVEEARRIFDDGCLERRGGFDRLAHRLAVGAEDWSTAEAIEARLEEAVAAKMQSGFQGRRSYLESLLPHLQGVRLLAQGEVGEACKRLQESDNHGLYWGLERSAMKLLNQGDLLRCLEQTGHGAGAAAARERLRRVNPTYLALVEGDEGSGSP